MNQIQLCWHTPLHGAICEGSCYGKTAEQKPLDSGDGDNPRSLNVLKGPTVPRQIEFKHYDTYGYVLNGPPQGPSGRTGTKGIFFLKKGNAGSFRSVVDVYRPDIPTQWITESPSPLTCNTPPGCVTVLLTFHDGDDEKAFSSSLADDVPLSRRAVGFWQTFRLLDGLAHTTQSERVQHATCVELSRWYALELPAHCRVLISGNPADAGYLDRLARLREKLREDGVSWAKQRIDAKNDEDAVSYLEFLAKNSDDQTSRVADGLLRSLKISPQ